MFLVTAAGGKSGQAVIRALVRRGEVVRAFVHSADHVAALTALGATDIVVGDLRDAQMLEEAARGVQAVYHICPAVQPDETAIGERTIAAAMAAGVEFFVYHSVLHPQTSALTHHAQKLRVEDALIQSGLPFTILQPSSYMQNMLMTWDRIVQQGVYTTSYGLDARMSLVDLEDLGEVGAIVLTEPGHRYATYELCGPQNLNAAEIAAILQKHLQRPVTAEEFSIDRWEQQMRAAGMDDYSVSTLATMFRYYAGHGFPGNSNILSYLLKRPATPLDEFVARTIKERK